MKVNIIDIIKGYISCILDINSNKANKAGLRSLYEPERTLTTTLSSKGDNYSSVELGTAVLCGNMLKVYFNATRSSNTDAGNVTNETIAVVKIDNSNKFIKNSVWYIGGSSILNGPVTSFRAYISKYETNYVYVTIELAAIHSAAKKFNGYIYVPVVLNIAS